MNVEKCKQWEKEKRSQNPKNPLTNRQVKKDGPKYKELNRACAGLIVDINSICMKWLKDNHNNLYSQLGQPELNKIQTITKSRKGKEPAPVAVQSPGAKIPSPVPIIEITDDSDDLGPQKQFYTIEDRQRYGETIKDYFSSIIIADGKACMTQNKSLLKYVSNHKLLGYGSFGNVYGVTIPKTKPPLTVAIKEGRISVSEFRKAMVKQYPLEYLFNKLINDLIDDKICPNFSYTFAIFFCDKCTLNEFDKKPIQTQCSETIVELFDFTLDKLKDLRDEVILSILFQILFAIACIQLKYGLFHNDIKKENILVKVIPSGGYWEYNVNGVTYQVPNYGYMVALNDFGVSIAFNSDISNKDYGRRQAKVVYDNNTNEYYFEPFTTQYYPSVNKAGKVTRIPTYVRNGQTWNHFYKNFDSKPSISVELNNLALFPAYYFNYDIIDTMYMFIGGKRTLQPGDHYAMKVSRNIHNLLKDYYLIRPTDVWPRNRVDLFLANHTIMKLFSFYLNSNLPGPLIEQYYL
jgi:serine/threonine protein kinase